MLTLESAGDLPETDAPALEDYFIGAGLVYTYAELQAWAELTGTPLTPWEAETLRKMTGAYSSQLAQSRPRDTPPPYSSGRRTANVGARLKRILRND